MTLTEELLKKQQDYALQLEEKKLAYALQLEQTKWEYKQHELAYVEAGNHMRALNLLMWQVPSIAIAVTGGLWYGAANLPVIKAQLWIFLFAALVDCMTIITLWRLRSLIGVDIEKQRTFELSVYNPTVTANPSTWILRFFGKENIVVKCWSFSLAAAALVSLLGAANADEFRVVASASQTSQQPVPKQQALKTSVPEKSLLPQNNSQDPIKKKQPEVHRHTQKSASDPVTPPPSSKRP